MTEGILRVTERGNEIYFSCYSYLSFCHDAIISPCRSVVMAFTTAP